MKKLTTALALLLLILGGVALANAADVPQAPMTSDLSSFQKLTDQEAQEIRGTGFSWGSQFVVFQTEAITPLPQNRAWEQSKAPDVGIRDRDHLCW
jgi:hypothetical protein